MTDCSGVPPRNACGVVLGEPAVYVSLGPARFSLTITMRGNICPATCVASPRELSAAEGEAAHRRVSDGCEDGCEEGTEASGGEEARPREAGCWDQARCREALHQGSGQARAGKDEGITTG